MKYIIFVCNGNIHRSVIAEACFRNIIKRHKIDKDIIIDSYGIQGTVGTKLPKKKQLSEYTKEWGAAKPTLDKLKIDINNHYFQMISEDVIKKADLIIAMDDKVYKKAENSLIKQFPKYKNKMYCFCEFIIDNEIIKDPSGNDDTKAHEQIITKICHTLNNRLDDILQLLFTNKC